MEEKRTTASPRKQEDDIGSFQGNVGSDLLLASLDVVAGAIPLHSLPAAGMAVKAAIRVTDMCQQLQGSLDQVDNLRKRIRGLSFIMVQELSRRGIREVTDSLKRDIEQFQNDLGYIEKKLRGISKQPSFLAIFFKNGNKEALQQCLRKVDGSLSHFELPQIPNDTVLRKLENDIRAYCRPLQETSENTGKFIKDIKALLQISEPAAQPCIEFATQKTPFPRCSHTLRGCDKLVNVLADKVKTRLARNDQVLVALLGPGGMGKTSVALAVMNHQSVRDRFIDSCRFWVPCAKAESVPLLLDTLHYSLCITRRTDDTLKDILIELESPSGKSQPHRILLLDGFETPWNLDDQEEIKHILGSLQKVPRLSLFITMRASQPPADHRWDTEYIQPLDPEASAKTYTDIYNEAGKQSQLPELLDAIGHIPLAINLIANYAKSNEKTPSAMLDVWGREGTGISTLETGHIDKLMERSMKLSIESPLMKSSPDAFKVLVLLTLFPAVVPTAHLQQFWMPPSVNWLDAFGVLDGAGLIQREDDSVSVIPAIRTYLVHSNLIPQPILHEFQEHILRVCCSLLSQHSSSPGNPSFKDDKEFISSEVDNFQGILLSATTDLDAPTSPELLDALLTLSLHHRWTRPRLDLIKHALAFFERVQNDKYIAECLACYAEMYRGLNMYAEAIGKALQAREKFIAIHDSSSAAHCLLRIVNFKMFSDISFEEYDSIIRQAQSEYGPDAFGQALCSFYLGRIHSQVDNRSDARLHLETAKTKLEELGKPFELAYCLQSLATIYCYQVYRADPAFPPSKKSLSIASELANQALDVAYQCDYANLIADVLQTFCMILKENGLYEDALRNAREACKIFNSIGNPLGVAQVCFDYGRILLQMNEFKGAKDAFQKALTVYEGIDADNSRKLVCQNILEEIETLGDYV
ncbi:hypothetical protein D9758_002294 [Tetrapyrgos nigripes]|uniref:NB-ARC domain-containing protein n=1 Tax=Tetrapyrgos nigripes TaxID=182062 RepID=A0A8H5LT44_9AGAR|nr:hypothetical protein D9758_002294 [Tetrapyrgos nigripes]